MALFPPKSSDEDDKLPIGNWTEVYSTPTGVDEMYEKWIAAQAPKQSITLSTPTQLTNVVNTSTPNMPISSINWNTLNNYTTYQITPMVTKHNVTVEVKLDDGSLESVTREELIKYISERKLIQENEAVRSMYERYQVAVKLVRSDDNGDTGV